MKSVLLVCRDAAKVDAETEPRPAEAPGEEERFPSLDDAQACGTRG